MRALYDLWTKHYWTDGPDLVIRHDSGEVRLPIEAISSHKHISLATLTIRCFSGHREDLMLTTFRSEEIEGLLKALHKIETQNHAKKPTA